MSREPAGAVSVVIPTFQRPEACERALRSALAQTVPPLEVLICDNGSRDGTQARFRDWEGREERVRYLRLPENSGTPAPARNLGLALARGEWVAFLDDDDEWLEHKLARQSAEIARGGADVIASNALRKSDGALYFPGHPDASQPARAQLLRANPIITSSVVMRRALAGFPTARWLRGVEDYAAWLSLADRGTRFLVLGEPLLRYEDAASGRLSRARTRGELALARLAWQRAVGAPRDAGNLRAALRRTAGAAYVAVADGITAARARAPGDSGAR